MRIGVVGSCQAPGVGIGLQQLLQEHEVVAIEANAARRENCLRQAAAALHECDIVFAHHLAEDFGPISTDVLRPAHHNFHLMPNIVFTGFHPDCIYVTSGQQVFKSPMQDYHSAIAAAAFASGTDAATAVALFNERVYRKLGYFEEFAKARAYLGKIMAEARLNISMEWPQWMTRAPFMHSINHPKGFALASIAKLMAAKANLLPYSQSFVEPVHDILSMDPIWPVYPELAAALNMPGSYLFKLNGGPDFATGRSMFIGLRQFVEASFSAYLRYPAEAFACPSVARVRQALQEIL
jgi:hypothetical protein